MRYLILFLTFTLIFIECDISYAQKKKKKIEPWEVEATYSSWYYEETNFGYNEHCVVSWQIVFQNNSMYDVRKIKFRLIIATNDDVILYKVTHTIYIDIEAGETVSSYVFPLKNKVCAGFSFEPDNFNWYAEVISVN